MSCELLKRQETIERFRGELEKASLQLEHTIKEKHHLERTVRTLNQQLRQQRDELEESQRSIVALRQQVEQASVEQEQFRMAQTNEDTERVLCEYDRTLFVPVDQVQIESLVLGSGSFGG